MTYTNNPFDPANLDKPDKYQRDFAELPGVVTEIAALKGKVQEVLASSMTHPAARAYFQSACDLLDQAAHKIHQGCNL